MKRSLLLLTLLFFACDSAEEKVELGQGEFILDGQSYQVNNAHFWADGANYIVITLSDGEAYDDYTSYTLGTKRHIWFILSPENVTASIPTGTFNFPQVNNATPAWRIVAGSLGTELDEDSGEFVYTDDRSSFYADIFDTQLSGTISISKEGSMYDLSFSMPSTRGGESLSGSYEGLIEPALPTPYNNE